MDKQKKLKIALPILVVVIAVVWGPIIMGSGSKSKKQKSASGINTISGSGGASDLISLARSSERKKSKTSYPEWGRNPFTLAKTTTTSSLEGILWDEQNPKAIVDGNIVGVGDQIGTGLIIGIGQNSITVKNGIREETFYLGE